MKDINVTFHTCLDAAKHQWKCFLAAVLVFSLLGAGFGWLYAGREAAPAQGSTAPLEPLDFSGLYDDAEYYYACFDALTEAYGNLTQYLRAVTGERTLSEEQKGLLEGYAQDVERFERETLRPIRTLMNAENALYVPEEFWEAAAAGYEAALETVRLDLIAAETAADIVKQMDAPDVAEETVSIAYETLLKQASQYGNLKRAQILYEELLDRLQNHADQVRADSRDMERRLEAAAKELNALAKEVSDGVDAIAAENHLLISIGEEDDGDTLQVTISHTHTESPPQDVFLLITLFCGMVGVCCGVFLAVCREAGWRKGKESEGGSDKSPSL